MIKKQNRLAQDHKIKRVLHRGVVRFGRYFKVRALKGSQTRGASRLAVIVGKKISNKATVRNRIKRRAKAVFAPEMPKIDGYEFVVFPQKTVEEAQFKALVEDARICLRKLVSF